MKIILIVIALALFFFPLPARFVERFYTNGFYAFLQPLLTPVANFVPFAIVDGLLIAVIIGLPAWWIVRLKRAGRGQRVSADHLMPAGIPPAGKARRPIESLIAATAIRAASMR